MIVKGIVDEDFVNYKKPSMFIAFPRCNWKCDRECGMRVCQNGALANQPDIEVGTLRIVDRYINNNISTSVVIGGLEPFDTWGSLFGLIYEIRKKTNDDIVIYTGYSMDECVDNGWIEELQQFKNIVVKFGRYIPGHQPHYDETLGVNLASPNQYAIKLNPYND